MIYEKTNGLNDDSEDCRSRPRRSRQGRERCGSALYKSRSANAHLSVRRKHAYRSLNITGNLTARECRHSVIRSWDWDNRRAIDERVTVVPKRCELDHGRTKRRPQEGRVAGELLPATGSTKVFVIRAVARLTRRITYRGSRATAKSDCIRNSPGSGESTSAKPVLVPGFRTPFSKVSTKNWVSNLSGVESSGEPCERVRPRLQKRRVRSYGDRRVQSLLCGNGMGSQ